MSKTRIKIIINKLLNKSYNKYEEWFDDNKCMKFVTLWFNICVYKSWICIYMKNNQNEYREELGKGRQREIL